MTTRRGSRSGRTKADLIAAVHARHGGLSRAEVAEAVDALFRTLKTTLMDGRPIRLEDFGSFEVQRRSGRTGVHPADGRPVEIPARRGVAFRPSRHVREGVASPDEKPGTPGKSGTERD